MPQRGVYKLLYVSVEHVVGGGAFEFGSFVADKLIRIKHIRAYLVSEGDFALLAIFLGEFGIAFGLFVLVDLGAEHLSGLSPVFVLRSLVLALHYQRSEE